MSPPVVDEPTPTPADESAPGEPAERGRFGFHQLEDVIADASFPEVDLALRRGRHVHQGDEPWYDFLLEAQPLLETFYRRYGCELERRSDGYFFLLPLTDSLGKRHLGVPEMIVGQGLALCFLEPKSVQSGGVVTREELLNQLAHVMGTDALMRTLNPKRKRADERVMQRTVRQKVNEALRRLSQLGFVEILEGDQLRLWPSLMRFAEPVRGLDAPSEALKRLIERGEVSLGPGDAEDSEPDVLADADSEPTVDADSETAADGDSAAKIVAGSAAGADFDADPLAGSVSDDPPPSPLDLELELEWDELPPDGA
jgi:chromosome partition protein MukE